MQSIGNWGLREEARKFWEHLACDECVHFAELPNINAKGSHELAEKYDLA